MIKHKLQRNFFSLNRILTTKSGVGQNGSALIISFIFMLVILVLVGSLFEFVTQNVKATRRAVAGEQAMALADAGVDKAVSELNATAGSYTGETGTVLGTGVFDSSVANLSASLKEITVTGYAPNKTNPQASRTVKIRVSINPATVSFNYGVQVGDGGLTMAKDSSILGNVYSNGPIVGASGDVITGDAYSAGSGGRIQSFTVQGNAYAHTIQSSIVGGSAHGTALTGSTLTGHAWMNSISSCTVNGGAHYTTRTACTVSGAITTPYPGDPDPGPEPFPITDQQITDWKAAAATGGTISGGYTLAAGQSVSLGPKKISGNLNLGNNAILTLTGPLWVTGYIDAAKDSTIKLAPSYGDISEVYIADGNIDLSKEVNFVRAGSNSYILAIGLSTSPGAISVAKSADALIIYAPNGTASVSKSSVLREITAWGLSTAKDTQVIYETGLANLQFSGGPGGSWTPVRGTWREIK